MCGNVWNLLFLLWVLLTRHMPGSTWGERRPYRSVGFRVLHVQKTADGCPSIQGLIIAFGIATTSCWSYLPIKMAANSAFISYS